jgi:D-glycero-D-manno-heptose 1,7-bisphosphate phosphatase
LKLIILDRDGVINHDSDDYIKSPQEWLPIAGSIEAIALLKRAGYHVAIATNQSGIGRDYYDLATLQAMHNKMQNLLAVHQVAVDYIAYCPHRPDEACLCRKPKAGMLLDIAQHFKVDLQHVTMVGDTLSDMQAAHNAGAHFVLVKTGKGQRVLASGNVPSEIAVYANLLHYTKCLLGEHP